MLLPSELPDVGGLTVAVDTETSGLFVDDGARVSVVSAAWRNSDDRLVSHAWAFDQGILDKMAQPTLFIQSEQDHNLPRSEWDALLAWLARQRLVFHNAKFDLHMLRAGTRHWPGRDLIDQFWYCTMVGAHVLWPTRPAGLKPVAARLRLLDGEERDTETELKAHLKGLKLGKGMQGRYDLADWSVIEPYAARDTELTLLLYEYQREHADSGGCRPQHMDREMRFLRTLYNMEKRGIRYDAAASLDAAATIAERLEQLERRLPFKPTVPAAKHWFFTLNNNTPHATTPTGLPRLDDEGLKLMAERGVEWAAEFYEHQRLSKALSMWYEGWAVGVGDDGRLRTSYKQTRVKSGRLSVERIQLQAIPKGDKTIDGLPPVKPMFLAKDGHLLWNLDLAQAELRLATHMAGCTRMQAMLDDGIDLHGVTTQEIFGIEPDHPEWKYKRDIAKRTTFGSIFRIGPQTFQANLAKTAGIYLPLGECKTIVYRWRDLYPEFGTAYYRWMRVAENLGWIELIGQERSYFGPLDYPNTAWNRRVQGSLAKGVKWWLMDIDQYAPGALLMTVHDSAVLELPEETGHETVAQLQVRGEEMLTRLFGCRAVVDAELWDNYQAREYEARQAGAA